MPLTEERVFESSDNVSNELSDDIESDDSGKREGETVDEGNRQVSDDELGETMIYGQDKDCQRDVFVCFCHILCLLKYQKMYR